jgi:hypothetical protein
MTISLGKICSLIYLHGMKCDIATILFFLGLQKIMEIMSIPSNWAKKNYIRNNNTIITLIGEMYLSSFMDEVHPSSISADHSHCVA